jgi:hypothetical protein
MRTFWLLRHVPSGAVRNTSDAEVVCSWRQEVPSLTAARGKPSPSPFGSVFAGCRGSPTNFCHFLSFHRLDADNVRSVQSSESSAIDELYPLIPSSIINSTHSAFFRSIPRDFDLLVTSSSCVKLQPRGASQLGGGFHHQYACHHADWPLSGHRLVDNFDCSPTSIRIVSSRSFCRLANLSVTTDQLD